MKNANRASAYALIATTMLEFCTLCMVPMRALLEDYVPGTPV